ncbi:uncharacterized protein EDB93DRAFT_1058038, partial [Suillus bovinus]|uniref:uncharacterized protein n=1 Tax=Suillus bovinus TaxID=48563 RepID=UPI001B882CA5
VHYMTYDLRWEYDTINPWTHCNVMVLSGETKPQQLYWYAQVLGVYHMNAWLNIEGRVKEHHIEVLFVRWLAPLSNHRSGLSCAWLLKVAFIEESDCDAFSFLDPGQVIRGMHLIPDSASGCGITSLHHGKSFACQCSELDDWKAYYISIFVDRDMFMWYTYHGIGHPKFLQEITRACADEGPRDGLVSEEDETVYSKDWESHIPCYDDEREQGSGNDDNVAEGEGNNDGEEDL